MNELKQVQTALEAADAVIPHTGQLNNMARVEIDKAMLAVDRLSAPVGVPVSMTLGDLEFLAEIKTAFEYLNTKPDADPERLWAVGKIFDAARAYLELQNADHIADAGKMVAPDDYKMVPIEPTEKICKAIIEQIFKYPKNAPEDIYKAMLSAAPTPAPSIPPQHGVLMPEGYIKAIGVTKPTTKLQKDVNLADGVNDCKFETPAPTEIDLEGLKREIVDFVYDYEGNKLGADIIDHLAAQFNFVRKV